MKFSRCAAVFLLLALWSPAHAAQPISNPEQGEKINFAQQLVEPQQIRSLSLPALRKLRGIVFGRHGRVFIDQDIQSYLKARPWYKPNPQFKVAALNPVERKNLDVIREAEARKHSHVEPGDLRFYANRVITPAQLGKHTLAELHIMRAEIEAIHGRRFPAEPWLQEYFNERYWYQPRAKYNPHALSLMERKNMALLAAREEKQRHLKLSPGNMGTFQKQLVHETMLRGLGLYELRLLRNEVYARRGQRFRTSWLSEHFSGESWYSPLPDYRQPILSRIEKRNVDLIVNYENRLHRELSTKPVAASLLKDLPLEDARKLRNEIYARRGRRFKDAWLQKYFASFDWYRPNAGFHDASLNAVEKRNAAIIHGYEKHAESLMSQIEA